MPPERLGRWLDRWADANGPVERTELRPGRVTFHGAAVAECDPPFPPLERPGVRDGFDPAPLLEHAARDRVVAVLLVRLGGHAAGVFSGRRLVDSKVGTRNVHGRHRAGGSSQRRFERMRLTMYPRTPRGRRLFRRRDAELLAQRAQGAPQGRLDRDARALALGPRPLLGIARDEHLVEAGRRRGSRAARRAGLRARPRTGRARPCARGRSRGGSGRCPAARSRPRRARRPPPARRRRPARRTAPRPSAPARTPCSRRAASPTRRPRRRSWSGPRRRRPSPRGSAGPRRARSRRGSWRPGSWPCRG